MNHTARIQSGATNAKMAWLLWALSTALLLGAFGLTVASGYSFGWILVFGGVQMAFSCMGAVLAARLRGNPLESTDALPGGTAALVVSSAIYGPGLYAVVLTHAAGHRPGRSRLAPPRRVGGWRFPIRSM